MFYRMRLAQRWLLGWMVILTLAPRAPGQDNAPAEAPRVESAADFQAELTPEQAARLKERDELATQVFELRDQGKLAEAIEAAGKALAIEREVFGEVHVQVAETLGILGDLQEAGLAFAAAERSRQAALDARIGLHGADDWRVTDARLALANVRILAKLKQSDRKKLSQAEDLNQRANLAASMGDFRAAATLFAQALAIQQALLGDDHRQSLATLSNLAGMYHRSGDHARAESHYRQALDLKKKVLGEQHPDYASGLNSLAALYKDLGDYARAEPLFLRAISIQKQVVGEQDPNYAIQLNNLATLYLEKGDHARAEPLFRQSLEIMKSVLGEEHPDYAASLLNLATLYRTIGDVTRAQSLYRQALEIQKRQIGENHPDYAVTLTNLGSLHRFTGDYERAEPLLRQALEIRKRLLGEEHLDYANSLQNLGQLYLSVSAYAQAEPLFQQAFEIQKRALGERHPLCADSLSNVALLYSATGDYTRAELLFLQALEITKSTVGEQHPSYAAGLGSLGATYISMGEYSRAEPLLQLALELTKNAFGDGHPAYARDLNNLAGLYYFMGDFARAEPLFQRALEIQRTVLGDAHPNCFTCRINLAGLYRETRDVARAEPLYEQALEIYKQAHGEMQPNYATGLNNLGELYHGSGDFLRAEPLYRQALDIRRRVLGEENPDTAWTLYNLATLYHATGDHTNSLARLRESAAAFDAARLRVARRGLDRAPFGAARSPYGLLAAAEAGQGESRRAWRALEASLARGLLDESSDRARLQLTPAEEQERAELNQILGRLNPRILNLVAQNEPTDEVQLELTRLLDEQSDAGARLARLAAALSQRQLADLEEVQAALRAEGAIVTWVDVSGKNDQIHEHWGCVVRADAPPAWVRLHGSGPDGAWTEDDSSLPRRFRTALTQHSAPEEVRELATQLAAQRIDPLLPHLRAIKRLYIAAVNSMSGVPLDVLTQDFTISYTPSATQLARSREREPLAREATLLVLGDPVLTRPADDRIANASPPRLPPGGLLITLVAPQSNAAQGRLEPGDVLLTYSGTELTDVDQLGRLMGDHAMDESVLVTVWRETVDQPIECRLRPGKLGVILSRDPAPDAITRRRENERLLASVTRGKIWDELPGTRIEVAALAKLFPPENVLVLADSDASEQKLAELREADQLAKFKYLHLATHGEVNSTQAFESALILARDNLSTAEDASTRNMIFDGRLTANEIRKNWKLNAELVTLSSCESALGRAAGGEGFLGFAQALLLAGSRSVCLSLWQVDDTATALLMERFYQNLLGKRDGLPSALPATEALAEAKRWIRSLTVQQVADLAADLSRGVSRGVGHKTNVVGLNPPPTSEPDAHPYDHPYYWAAFVLIGNPD